MNELTKGERLKDLRVLKGLTMQGLADITGVSESTITRFENDENYNIGSTHLIAIAKYFGVTTDYLLGLSEYKTPQAADIGSITGLSDDTIISLKHLKNSLNSEKINLCNDLLYLILNSQNMKGFSAELDVLDILCLIKKDIKRAINFPFDNVIGRFGNITIADVDLQHGEYDRELFTAWHRSKSQIDELEKYIIDLLNKITSFDELDDTCKKSTELHYKYLSEYR